MRRRLVPASLVAVCLFCLTLAPVQSQSPQPAPESAPIIVIETAKGVIEIETFPAEAPVSVKHIVELAKKGFYRGQRFHWVMPGVVQTGDPHSRDLTKQKDWGTGGSGLRHSSKPLGIAELGKRRFERGIVGLAYRPGFKPETADSQFFILTAPNPALNGKYAPIGRVIKGMNVVDKIAVLDVLKNVTIR